MYKNATARDTQKSKKVKHFPQAKNSIAQIGRLNKWRFRSGKVLLNAANFFLDSPSGMYALITGTRTVHQTMTVMEHPVRAGSRTTSV